jgi:hypothetical protein
MHPTISYELATARNADLRSQAQRAARARAAAHVSSSGPPPGRNPIPASPRRTGRPRQFRTRLWALLHAQVLLDGPAARPQQRQLHAQAARLGDGQ